jgi:hypothetical protein
MAPALLSNCQDLWMDLSGVAGQRPDGSSDLAHEAWVERKDGQLERVVHERVAEPSGEGAVGGDLIADDGSRAG